MPRGAASRQRALAHLLLDRSACAAADVGRPRPIVGVCELNGSRAAADADALTGERLVQRGRFDAGDAGQHGLARPGRPSAARPGSSSAAAAPDGDAESPAATMRGSSMLVSVSSVSNRPSASVVRPLAAARPGTPKPAVHTVTALGQRPPVGQHHAVSRHRGDLRGVDDGDAQLGQTLGHRAPARGGQ